MKIEKINITFSFDEGNYSIEKAEKFPTKEDLEEMIEGLQPLIGKFKKMIITIVEK